MSLARHAAHGWGLLIVGAVLILLLVGAILALLGIPTSHPIILTLLCGLTLIATGVGWLWRRGRVGWAWALLLAGPGVGVVVGAGIIMVLAAHFAGSFGG